MVARGMTFITIMRKSMMTSIQGLTKKAFIFLFFSIRYELIRAAMLIEFPEFRKYRMRATSNHGF